MDASGYAMRPGKPRTFASRSVLRRKRSALHTQNHALELGRELRLSYLPPLMVYVAAGISGLTGIVGTFFVKDYLGLSAALLAALGFWAGIPWALKMPLGHLVDLIWRWKSWLVYVGAGLIAASLLVMVALISDREAMSAVMPPEAWYVLSVLLAPIGYVIQDAVADAMTVEAVPRVDAQGRPFDPATRKLMHTTMQTLGRVAIIGGSVLVALINLYLFSGVEGLPETQIAQIYRNVYLMALAIPMVSVLGVISASLIKARDKRRLLRQGFTRDEVEGFVTERIDPTAPNWWILGGSLFFVAFTLVVGLNRFQYSEEIVFAGSLAIVLFLIARLTRSLEPEARATLVGTAIVIFVFRAVPGPGPGVTWWMIDELGFDQQFLSVLSLIGSSLKLAGMFIFRRFMAERSIAYVVVDRTAHGRRSGRALHRAGRYGVGVAAGTDCHDSDAGVDRQLSAGQSEGDLLRHHGFVHESRTLAVPARYEISEPDLHRHARGARPSERNARDGSRLQPARRSAADPTHHRPGTSSCSDPLCTTLQVP
jgi:hypothetical protein